MTASAVTALLLVALPFAAACFGLAVGRRVPALVGPVAVGGTAGATVLALFQAVEVLGSGRVGGGALGTVPTGGPPITVALMVDGTAASVAVMVCVVALLVQVYSTAYLRDDPRYSSYAAFVSLFTAAMLLVVVAGDLLVLLVGWEVMGICSYFLIGHWWETEDARGSAVKAFLVTRLGDVGFLFGIFALGMAAGSFRIGTVLAAVPRMPATVLTAAALLLLCGVAGKSAQFPLHTWLPDAMAGPTPISALIHAATMVAAGIYVVARLYPVFLAAPAALAVLGVLAAVGMLGAALAALAQEDIKRVLAYSTISQLAYMAGGLAVGGRDPALFHLLGLAAYKALLFLAAGAVIHAVHSNLMSDMGGLRAVLPVTFPTMALGLAALAGVPPLAGFFSKESILGAAEETALHGGPVAAWVGWLVLLTGLLTVAVTAAYATRLLLRTFFGPARPPPEAAEPPAAMRWPLVVLAVPTALLGLAGVFPGLVPSWVAGGMSAAGTEEVLTPGGAGSDVPATAPLEEVVGGPVGFVPGLATTLPSLLLVVLGAYATYAVWRRDPAADPARSLGPARRAFASAFGVDAVYDALVFRPALWLAEAARRADLDVVDAYVRGSGRGARVLGGALRFTQTGNAQRYLTGLLAGVVLLLVGAAVLT